jgi:hypothetical protein
MKGHAVRRLRLLSVLVGHVLLPLWFILLLATMGSQDSSTWLLILIAAASHIAYISVAGAWSWFGPYFQRSLPVIMIAVAFVTRPRVFAVNDSPTAAELRLLSLALAVYFVVRMIFALLGRRSGGSTIELSFPLRSGSYMVAQGGRSRVVNHHARNRAQRYAIDLVKLGSLGIRAAGLYPVSLKKYTIFGEQVRSPCEGIVLSAIDDLPDQIPPGRDVQNGLGNHVVIERDGTTVYLAHLMKGSVTVEAGRRIRLGQILGRVGNSGDSTEPHLHVHVEKDGAGIPMRFGGRFLVRNDSVEAPERD